MNFTHDYTKTMMMKLKMADPDKKGGSIVYCDAQKALEMIQEIDEITLGIKKIVYLVGWQYCGHDDKYPAFFEVNDAVKRAEDKSAHESLLHLMKEAKKYNTIVSLHVNFTDAYEDSPIFDTYKKANAFIRTARGKYAKIEKYNGKACYKISYKEEWTSGLFHKRIDRLLSLFPIEEAGTLHVDNFQCYVNRSPYISAEEMQYYRDKMIEYLREKHIDITSEFTYREGKASVIGYGKITRDVIPTRYPIALLNKIPAVWWADKMTLEEYFHYYPHLYGGGLPKNKKAKNLFYGNIHAEEQFLLQNWHDEFIKQFFTVNVPFFFLNEKTRVGFTNKKRNEVRYSDSTLTRSDASISVNGEKVKEGNKIFLPYCGGYAVYSDTSCKITGKVRGKVFFRYEITAQGLKNEKQILADENGRVLIDAQANTAYFIKEKKELI